MNMPLKNLIIHENEYATKEFESINLQKQKVSHV